ncbi:hypothetical protein L1987_06842 [Smallanthus sonchifolius]|uniref:Uncharacterized protein n=1 Tax=Smallanthus sonchifolius TaxID=185202 RepID=A0ACB9JZ95_9ASTR|nr:hypothetical protein L1987_06842 [Smallanthus sonchifolius]
MLGFSDGESPSKSSSSDDGANNVQENVNAPIYGHENETLQQAVNSLTTLVATLNPKVLSQGAEVNKLKQRNLKLSHAQSSKFKSFKRLVKGPPSKPSYKNFRVSSSSSNSDDAGRKEENQDIENEDKEANNLSDDADYVLLLKIKGKGIAFEEDIQIPQLHETHYDENEEINKELEEEYSRGNLLEMQTVVFIDEQDEREKIEKDMAKTSAAWLASILAKELEEEKRKNRKRKKYIHVGRMYMKRKFTLVPESVESSKPTPADTPKSP